MSVNMSIKAVPDDIIRRLRLRAERNHRSLQGEVMAILEDAVRPSSALAPDEVLVAVRRLRVATPSESAAMIREDRDGR
jgi:plasmid stability protein